MTAGYVPQRGELLWLIFDPQAGYEQAAVLRLLTLRMSVIQRSALQLS